jgi:prefoldin beta subunit
MVSQEKLQEMQFLEQNLQSLMMQKQAFQMELSETKAALKELDNSGDDVFKLVGQLMLKTDKKKMKEELITKEKLLEKRTDTLQTQEVPLMKKLDDLRQELMKTVSK